MNQPEPRSSPCYCIQVRRAANALTNFYDRALEPSGLTVSQFSLLNDIISLGSCNKSELARYTKLDRTTIIRNLRALQTRGLIAEIPGTDKRNRLICLTDLGKTSVEKGLLSWKEAQRQIRAAIGEEELEDFMKALENLESLADSTQRESP